jgi:hypothetical protein
VFTSEQCCGSGMFIPDPESEFFHPGSRVGKIPGPDPHQRIKVFLTQKLFLSSLKYLLGCSSRIRILIFYPYRSKKHRIPDPGSGAVTLLLLHFSRYRSQLLCSTLQRNSFKILLKNKKNLSIWTLKIHGNLFRKKKIEKHENML